MIHDYWKIALYQYLQLLNGLPVPSGSLSHSVSPGAIEDTNDAVRSVCSVSPKKSVLRENGIFYCQTTLYKQLHNTSVSQHVLQIVPYSIHSIQNLETTQ